jgi:hypothetical protein
MPNGQTPDKSRRWHDGSALVISDRDENGKTTCKRCRLILEFAFEKEFYREFLNGTNFLNGSKSGSKNHLVPTV